jgi:phosphate:Na+ symporter
VFSVISAIFKPLILNEAASYFGIAVCHSLFNVLCTVLLLPASSLLEKLAYKLVPETKAPEKVVELDERLLATPPIAVEQSYHLTCKMAVEAIEGFKLSIQAIDNYSAEIAERIRQIEDNTDHYEDVLGTYLTKLSKSQVSDEDSATVTKLLKAIGDFERISDHAVNVVESVEELREKGIEFSSSAKAELDVLCRATDDILNLTEAAFVNADIVTAYDVEPLEEVIDDIKTILRNNHISRLKEGSCTVETGFVWGDLLTNFERVSDHCSNIAIGLIDESEHTMNAHESVKVIKENDAHYSEKYAEYSNKYAIS